MALKLLGAFLVPFLFAWLGTASAYWAGTISSSWPMSYVLDLVGIAVGVFSILAFDIQPSIKRNLIASIYVPVCLVGIFFTALFTACSYGDCL